MANIFSGHRPDLTPAQIVSGIPILAELLRTFGVYDLSPPQQDSLSKAATWALALIAGDTLLRIGRNVSTAQVQSAAVVAGAAGAAGATGATPDPGPAAADGGDVTAPVEALGQAEDLPGDAEEFESPPPGVSVPGSGGVGPA